MFLHIHAQLVSLYSHAFALTKDPLYKQVVYEIIAFVKRELTSSEGGFYSSLDADGEGEEGRFYVWSLQEIKQILGSDAALFADYFGIMAKATGSLIKTSRHQHGRKRFRQKYNLSHEALLTKIDSLKNIVLNERAKRVRTHTDDKILTSWNALMAKGLLDAYQVLNEKCFWDLAQTNIDFLLKNITTNQNGLYRNYKNDNANIHAFLGIVPCVAHLYGWFFVQQITAGNLVLINMPFSLD